LAQLIAASSSLKRLASLANFDIPRLIERNAFKALIPWQGDKRKLDIHYSKADSLIRTGNLRLFSSLNVSSVRKLTVVDAGHRVYFPGYLLCKDEIGRSTRVWIVDHVMSFLLEGDSVTVRCKEVASDTEKELVGSKVVDVVLH